LSQAAASLFATLLIILAVLIGCSGCLYLRRKWVVREQQRHALHVRLLRAELMQALARDESAFLIDHWTRRDRKAAFEVAAQLLGFVKGRDRKSLEAIVETNGILNPILLRINRISKRRRIAAIRNLAAFGNRSVQGTLEHLMLNDVSNEVRLEAAIAITVAGELPAPWCVIRSVCEGVSHPSPNHFRLFEQMMPEKCEAMLALATLQDDRTIRLLALHALGLSEPERAVPTLLLLTKDEDAEVAAKAAETLDKLRLELPRTKPMKKATVVYLVDKRAA
jgi:HEAT repeat protein